MVLIDKETVYKELSEYYHHTAFIQHLCLEEELDRVPVVDAEPVRHGHWVGIDDEPCEVWECDMCGYIYEGDFVYNYCPHCGAKMGETE